MEGIDNGYLGKHKKFRTDSRKLATAFLITAFSVAIIVFWWLKLVGVTVTGEAFCGIDEHTHGSECYISEVVCGFDEKLESTTDEASEEHGTETEESTEATEITQEETESFTASEVTHIHTDKCYEKTLVCEKAEHIHSESCFPDKTADVENVSDWLRTIENVEITNDIPENLIVVAMSQVGYKESEKNFEYDGEGSKNGYTRYGEWYGNPYGKWNTMFVSFCLHYSNINNVSELKSAGAEAMRLAWQSRYAYSSAKEYTPQRGDVVFVDSDGDKIADRVAIALSVSSDSLRIICGDSNNKVEIIGIDVSDDIIGYGLTSELHFAEDKEYKEDSVQTTTGEEDAAKAEEVIEYREPLMMMAVAPEPNITYLTDLSQFIVDVNFRTEDNIEITEGSTVYIGQTYVISMEFKEKNTGDHWLQFGHNDQHYLTYQIPSNIHCEPFETWHSITAITENGTIEDVGKYFINADGELLVTFYDDDDGVCFGHRYSNVDFVIEFNATVGETQSGTTSEIVFSDEIKVELDVDGGAGVSVSKTHGDYDSDNYTVDYTVTVEATHGVVKGFTMEDYTWYNQHILKDTIVVTDLDGVPLDPQPTIGDQFTQADNIVSGFSIVGLPDFSAGEGFLITYKSKIADDYTTQDTVSLGNGVYGAGKDSNGETVDAYKEHWVSVEPEKMSKDGRQTVIEVNGQSISVIEWRVAIKKNQNNLHGTIIIDTLGEGLQYFTGKDIIIYRYDENGENAVEESLSWNSVEINGNSMSFPLPDGYMFEIVYYTVYEEPDDGGVKNYTNSVSATINGKYETAGGEADVVSFVPRIHKSASGNDGQYVYFTIEADVPAVIKNWGNFYLTDESSLWHNTLGSFYYVDNMPEDLIVTAVTESGQTVSFSPYVPGGPTENTYIIEAPLEGDRHHSFRIFFNTSSASEESSTWILNEDSVLRITYKLPFDAKTGTEWSGELTGDKTLETLLAEGHILGNTANLNYTDVITDSSSSSYTYSPKITKNSQVHDDGTIDYTVVFHNTVPGSNGNAGILSGAQNIFFTDTFDEKMEYVPGSLTLTCFDPWNSNRWLNTYKYNGGVIGNSMNIPATDFEFDTTNPNSGWGLDWLASLSNYQIYCNNMSGGDHIFTYTLKLKDEYLYSTEENKYELDNTAEIIWDTDGSSGPVTETSEIKTGLIDKAVAQEKISLISIFI